MRRDKRVNLTAGLTVAVVALPLALGFGVASGLGASAGLVTAVVAGAAAAVFGGSNLQVSGPTGAMTVVLVPIVARYGTSGVLTVGLLAGILLVMLALARAGRFARLVPVPVVEGFTVGIAAVIFIQQVPGALGITAHGERVVPTAINAARQFASTPHWAELLVAGSVTAMVLVGLAWRPRIPFSLLAVAGSTLLASLLALPVDRIGALPAGLPAPTLAFLNLGAIRHLATAAIAVAALAALESLLCASVADSMRAAGKSGTVERHDPDKELFGQGIANLVVPLFGGIPATAAIARTAVSVKAGATTRLAALSHAVILAAIVLAIAPLVALIPIAALAGVLFATAIRMVHLAVLTRMARASRSDAVVLVLTASATLAFDLVTAVLVGLGAAVILTLRKVIKAVHVERIAEAGAAGEPVVLRPVGPLFWAGAHNLELQLAAVDEAGSVLIRMSRVSTIDASGAQILRDAIAGLHRRGVTVYLSGLHAAHRRPLDALGVLNQLAGHVYDDAAEALAAAHQNRSAHFGHAAA
ncbi:SulP family inorganic anion transporter [Asanoa sp. NPDC049518]|uniref:SulP family inorganic anion transporter n=1 Tax=unclassified Asanoa TaxID=2685164 RepID=UPI0034191880